MFLRFLKNEQKKMFFALANEAAKVNGEVVDAELQLLKAYADEMGIDDCISSELSLDKILDNMKAISSKEEINKMTFEIVAMLICDGLIDGVEKDFLNKIVKKFDLSDIQINRMIECINEYYAVVKKINRLMLD